MARNRGITTGELRALLGCSFSRIYYLVHEGIIPRPKKAHPRRFRWTLAEVERVREELAKRSWGRERGLHGEVAAEAPVETTEATR